MINSRIHDLDFDRYTYECVSINRQVLNDEFSRVSADLAYWGERLARADRALAGSKLDRDVERARLYAFHRLKLEETSRLRVTDTAVDSRVLRSSNYRVRQEHVINCELERQRVHQVLEAIKTKRDMLISLGAQMRAEMQHEPKILKGREEDDIWER